MSEMAKKLSTEEYKGVRDFYPEDMAVQNYIFGIWRKTLESFGYSEYDASILEPTELYEAKSGEELINEQTYTFIDRGGRSVTLRPEMTPTVARMVAKRRRELAFPLRWYSIPNLFRYERPQRGRVREHFQLNADIFGAESSEAEIELVSIADTIMKNFGLNAKQFEIRLSSRKLINAIFSEWYELDEEKAKKMQKLIDKKSKMGEEEFEKKAQEITSGSFSFLNLSKHSEVRDEALAMPMIREAYDELHAVIARLHTLGIANVSYDPELIRGFDYYTGIIFEVFDTHPDNNRSLFGGGRYDGLISLFGEDNVPAAGFGMGDVTIRDVLETYSLLPENLSESETKVSLLCMNEQAISHSEKLASVLRKNNINCSVNFSLKKISDQIKHAEKSRIPYVIVIGEDEIKNEMYGLKNIITGEERKFAAEKISL